VERKNLAHQSNFSRPIILHTAANFVEFSHFSGYCHARGHAIDRGRLGGVTFF
jgi:hypothetical protein